MNRIDTLTNMAQAAVRFANPSTVQLAESIRIAVRNCGKLAQCSDDEISAAMRELWSRYGIS